MATPAIPMGISSRVLSGKITTRSSNGAATGPESRDSSLDSSFVAQTTFVGDVPMDVLSGIASGVRGSAMQLAKCSTVDLVRTYQWCDSAPSIVRKTDLSSMHTSRKASSVEPIPDIPAIEIGNVMHPENGVWKLEL